MMGRGGRSNDIRRPRRDVPFVHICVPVCTCNFEMANQSHLQRVTIDIVFIELVDNRDKLALVEAIAALLALARESLAN